MTATDLRRTLAMAAGLCACLAVFVVAWVAPLPKAAEGQLSAGAPEASPEAIALTSSPARLSYANIEAHPLFEPSRTPWQPPSPATPLRATLTGPAEPRGYIVTGLLLSGTETMALLQDASNKTRVLRPNATLDGWRVARIDSEGVLLESTGRRVRLTITRARR